MTYVGKEIPPTFPICDYPGCQERATHIWSNAIDVYCTGHYRQFMERRKQIAGLVKKLRRESERRAT